MSRLCPGATGAISQPADTNNRSSTIGWGPARQDASVSSSAAPVAVV